MRLVRFLQRGTYDNRIVEPGEEILVRDETILGPHMLDVRSGRTGPDLTPDPNLTERIDWRGKSTIVQPGSKTSWPAGTPDYTAMSEDDIKKTAGTDNHRWATAFVQHAEQHGFFGILVSTVESWFAKQPTKAPVKDPGPTAGNAGEALPNPHPRTEDEVAQKMSEFAEKPNVDRSLLTNQLSYTGPVGGPESGNAPRVTTPDTVTGKPLLVDSPDGPKLNPTAPEAQGADEGDPAPDPNAPGAAEMPEAGTHWQSGDHDFAPSGQPQPSLSDPDPAPYGQVPFPGRPEPEPGSVYDTSVQRPAKPKKETPAPPSP